MSGNLLLLVAGIYTYTAVEQIFKGNAALGVAFLSYAVSNLAFFFLTK
jgi:hypothetical protein